MDSVRVRAVGRGDDVDVLDEHVLGFVDVDVEELAVDEFYAVDRRKIRVVYLYGLIN